MKRDYRVTWRRYDWESSTANKSRIFARRADAEAFMEKLEGDERLDLSPIEFVYLDSREVGDWEEVWS